MVLGPVLKEKDFMSTSVGDIVSGRIWVPLGVDKPTPGDVIEISNLPSPIDPESELVDYRGIVVRKFKDADFGTLSVDVVVTGKVETSGIERWVAVAPVKDDSRVVEALHKKYGVPILTKEVVGITGIPSGLSVRHSVFDGREWRTLRFCGQEEGETKLRVIFHPRKHVVYVSVKNDVVFPGGSAVSLFL